MRTFSSTAPLSGWWAAPPTWTPATTRADEGVPIYWHRRRQGGRRIRGFLRKPGTTRSTPRTSPATTAASPDFPIGPSPAASTTALEHIGSSTRGAGTGRTGAEPSGSDNGQQQFLAARPFYGLSPGGPGRHQRPRRHSPAAPNSRRTENQAATQVTAEDADAGDAVTYAITGGADLALFSTTRPAACWPSQSRSTTRTPPTPMATTPIW